MAAIEDFLTDCERRMDASIERVRRDGTERPAMPLLVDRGHEDHALAAVDRDADRRALVEHRGQFGVAQLEPAE